MATHTVDVSARLEQLRKSADYTAETLQRAEDILTNARMQISGGASHLGSLILDGCYQAWTTEVETFAVTLAADGFPILCLNPNFAVALTEPLTRGATVTSGGVEVQDDSGVVFVLLHEASHLLFRHLRRQELQSEMGTLACEATINYFVHQMLTNSGRSGAWNRTKQWMPSTPKMKADGTPAKDSSGNPARERSGVDPWKLHATYRKNLLSNGDSPVDIEHFYISDSECLRQLSRMTEEPKPPTQPCEHMSAGGSPADEPNSTPETSNGNGTSTSQEDAQRQQGSSEAENSSEETSPVSATELDQGAVDEVVQEVLRQAIVKALREGSESGIRRELLELAEITPEASELWSDLGLGALRGETVKTRRVDWWAQWLSNQIASRLQESDRLVHDRSIVWETRLGWVGDDEKHKLLIALDTSGSMPTHVIDQVANLVGTSDQFDADWVCFDGEVWPFNPGEPMTGGGGTSFQIIDDYAKTLEEEPDAVIVLTDGYAPPITPTNPENWIWLITEDGDMWPEKHDIPMSCFPISTENIQ